MLEQNTKSPSQINNYKRRTFRTIINELDTVKLFNNENNENFTPPTSVQDTTDIYADCDVFDDSFD